MQLQRTFSGLEATLQSRGAGRFFGASFLLVWLIGWAIGEVLVLGILFLGARSLVTGEPPGAGREPLALAPALAAGLFLLTWLAFWTFGGIAAGYEFMRLLWSRDHVLVRRDGIEVRRRAGLLARTTHVRGAQVRRLYRRGSQSALMVETTAGPVEVTRLGTQAEQEDLQRAIVEELKLEQRGPLPAALPVEWRELPAIDGGSVLIKNPATRRRQAWVAGIIAGAVGVVAVIIVSAAVRDLNLAALAAIAAAAALALMVAAGRLAFVRIEWKLETGRIVQRRRVGLHLTPLFEGRALVIDSWNDSDGDACHAVHALAPTPPNASLREQRRARRTLLHGRSDPSELRLLAEWIARRTGIPCTDHTTPAAKTAELADMVDRLNSLGRVGRWVAGMARRRADKR